MRAGPWPKAQQANPRRCSGPRVWFLSVWDTIYGTTEFASTNDPWVWAIGFERLTTITA